MYFVFSVYRVNCDDKVEKKNFGGRGERDRESVNNACRIKYINYKNVNFDTLKKLRKLIKISKLGHIIKIDQ